MGFGLFFVPLIGGYLFLALCNYTRFLMERETGYRLLFNSASTGIVLVVLAWLIAETLDYLVPSIYSIVTNVVSIPYAEVAAFAFFLGPLTARVVNIWYPDFAGAMRAVRATRNDLESLFVHSMETESLIEITLENGKVYVGWIVNAAIPALDRRFIAISPLISGFRDEKQKVVFTVNYAKVYRSMYGKKWAPRVDQQYFRVVLPVSTLRSARLFDVDIYIRFEEVRKPNQGL